MNSTTLFRLSKLSLGARLGGGVVVGGVVPRTSIRLASVVSAAARTKTPTEVPVMTRSQMKKQAKRQRKVKKEPSEHRAPTINRDIPPGVKFEDAELEEKIYVWANPLSRQVVYSIEPRIIGAGHLEDDGELTWSTAARAQQRKALRQLPFNGKKTKPAKLRLDYWSQMAMIELPAGTRHDVYKKLRELRQLHELSWSDDIIDQERNRRRDEPIKLSGKRILGRALNNQYANTVADIAAVLGGVGYRNSMICAAENCEYTVPRPKKGKTEGKEAEKAWEEELPQVIRGQRAMLLPAKVHWANDRDQHYAAKWTPNVKHELLPDATILRNREFAKATAAEKKAMEDEKNKYEIKAKEATKWRPMQYLLGNKGESKTPEKTAE
ncbi:hypothetical protein CPLU01_01659 [Colletotrichum plurivorum]|uniref:Large ribosomal subunit protein mL67 n=1 Tax=Colletotrichum plurivorum TaxID=2175906 RepID=A0A8H6NNS6_9PEZI|nr:hypothetical protein CPLU01_01659 [Colletotrichum plurivorum]